VNDGSRLSAIGGDIATWIIPTADPYVFLVKGNIAADADRGELESAVQDAIASLADIPAAEFEAARSRLLERLVLDLQTTEDAAHQLAYFEGIGALDALLDLPARIGQLEPGNVSRLARERLGPEQRTVGWVIDGRVAEVESAEPAKPVARDGPLPPTTEPAPPAETRRLSNGIPVLLQRSALSPTAQLLVALGGDYEDAAGRLSPARPVTGSTAFEETVPADRLAEAVRRAGDALRQARPAPAPGKPGSLNPYTRFEELVDGIAVRPEPPRRPTPTVIAVSGDIDPGRVMAMFEAEFGSLPPPAEARAETAAWAVAGDLDEHIPRKLAQARVGYIVPAPPPGDPASDAWRALMYILSHDYGGRLGDAAISERGLVYYIDTRYRSDGERALVTLSSGVDPEKQQAMRDLLEAELARLESEPPSAGEIEEALRWRRGRAVSAAQSNAEIAEKLAIDWLWYGELLDAQALDARLSRVSRDDVLAAVDAFLTGSVVTITVD